MLGGKDREQQAMEDAVRRLIPVTGSMDELVESGRQHAKAFHDVMNALVQIRRRYLDKLSAARKSVGNRQGGQLPERSVNEDETLVVMLAEKNMHGLKMEECYEEIFNKKIYVGTGEPFEISVLDEMLDFRTKSIELDKKYYIMEMIIFELTYGKKFEGPIDTFKQTPFKVLYPYRN